VVTQAAHDPRVDQIQDNFVAYLRLFAGVRGVEFVDDDVTWVVTDAGAPGNIALRSRFTDAAADRRIDEVLGAIGRHADYVEWLVFPGCRPANLAGRLTARGAAGGPGGRWELEGDIGGPGGAWMAADLGAMSDAPAGPWPSSPFRIERVSNLAMLEEWRAASAAGFGGGELHNFLEAYARDGFGDGAQALHYLGRLDGRPVTSGTLLLAAGCAGIYDVSTPGPDRRNGFGAAITDAMMRAARERGYAWAWLQSSPIGRSVYAGLGFTEIAAGVREYRWKRR
jgi:hypothetical protein